MNRFFRLQCAPAVMLAALLASCATLPPRVPARIALDREVLDTTLDSELARYYANAYRSGRGGDPAMDAHLRAALAALPPGMPDRDALRELAQRTSPDVAALHLADRLLSDPVNRRFEAVYAAALRSLEAAVPRAGDYRIVFVPGWGYRSAPGNGADFAAPRAVLSDLGVETVLVETDENGAVEDNAAVTARAISDHAAAGRDLIVVSASKSAAEVGLALSQLGPAAAARVRGWLNVVGILRGSPLADWAMSWPRRGLTTVSLATSGFGSDGLASMTTQRSRERFRRLSVPEHVIVVNYIGIPLSGTISDRAQRNYLRLRGHGPNDGFSLLVDQIYPGGITLFELGRDHYMLGADMGARTAALARTLMDWLDAPG